MRSPWNLGNDTVRSILTRYHLAWQTIEAFSSIHIIDSSNELAKCPYILTLQHPFINTQHHNITPKHAKDDLLTC